jgi:hypothetical protein
MIYTHDEAMLIVEMFEDVLSRYNISVPSDEDDERGEGNTVGLYGSTYSDLLDSVEENICSILARCRRGEKIIENEFSGTV